MKATAWTSASRTLTALWVFVIEMNIFLYSYTLPWKCQEQHDLPYIISYHANFLTHTERMRHGTSWPIQSHITFFYLRMRNSDPRKVVCTRTCDLRDVELWLVNSGLLNFGQLTPSQQATLFPRSDYSSTLLHTAFILCST